MEVLTRLRELMDAHGWSMYRLAKESGLTNSTIANIFRRNALPSIDTLEKICNGFGITLAQFFSTDSMVELTPELQILFERWKVLTPKQKAAVIEIMAAFEEHDN